MLSKLGKRRLFVETLESRRLLAADPGVLPVDSHAFGTTYGEQAGEWWNWALAEPAETNPLVDDTGENCGVNQNGKIWYLAGTFGDGPVERSCTIPTGKAIFVPVLNTFFFATEPEETEEEMREGANAFMDNPQSLAATLDGNEIDPADYRAESPDGGFIQVLPEGSILTQFFGLPAGEYSPAVADGYWLMLAPLSEGTHQLSFSAIAADGFAVQISYELEVVGGNGKSDLSQPIAKGKSKVSDDTAVEAT